MILHKRIQARSVVTKMSTWLWSNHLLCRIFFFFFQIRADKKYISFSFSVDDIFITFIIVIYNMTWLIIIKGKKNVSFETPESWVVSFDSNSLCMDQKTDITGDILLISFLQNLVVIRPTTFKGKNDYPWCCSKRKLSLVMTFLLYPLLLYIYSILKNTAEESGTIYFQSDSFLFYYNRSFLTNLFCRFLSFWAKHSRTIHQSLFLML